MSNFKKFLFFGGIVVVALALYIQKFEEVATPTPVQPEKLNIPVEVVVQSLDEIHK